MAAVAVSVRTRKTIKLYNLFNSETMRGCKNEALRCGLEKKKSDGGAARGLIPTYVKEAEWKNEVS